MHTISASRQDRQGALQTPPSAARLPSWALAQCTSSGFNLTCEADFVVLACFSVRWAQERSASGSQSILRVRCARLCNLDVLSRAGLAAARQLRAFGHLVIILEGNARPGGRVYTKRLEVQQLRVFPATAKFSEKALQQQQFNALRQVGQGSGMAPVAF